MNSATSTAQYCSSTQKASAFFSCSALKKRAFQALISFEHVDEEDAQADDDGEQAAGDPRIL